MLFRAFVCTHTSLLVLGPHSYTQTLSWTHTVRSTQVRSCAVVETHCPFSLCFPNTSHTDENILMIRTWAQSRTLCGVAVRAGHICIFTTLLRIHLTRTWGWVEISPTNLCNFFVCKLVQENNSLLMTLVPSINSWVQRSSGFRMWVWLTSSHKPWCCEVQSPSILWCPCIR